MNFNKIFLILILFSVFFSNNIFSQNDTIRLSRSVGLQIGGFTRTDYIFDTRQTSEAVEGLFTFYPLPKVYDENGNDINASARANFLALSTRLSTRFFAPDILGAKSSAYIEFDFTGTSNTNGVRLRQANINLTWQKSTLLIGRAWHPMSLNCMPNVVGLSTGAPFFAFNRSDQVRFDYRPGKFAISLIALYQSDYATLGPVGKSPSYLRDAVLPEFNLNLNYKTPIFSAGLLGNIKTIKPRLVTEGTGGVFKTDEKLTSISAQAYIHYQFNNLSVKAQSNYAQNLTESLMFGGYAVSNYDPVTGHEKYTPSQHMNYWLNVDYGKKMQIGLFAGYLHNLGTIDNVAGNWYARMPDAKYLYRISPHLFYNHNNWQFAAELEYTAAAYGDIDDSNKGKVINTYEVGNFRTNLMICFFF